jgi:hypothetical protein
MHRIAVLALFCLLPGAVLAQEAPPDAPVAAPPLVPAPEVVEPEPEPVLPGPPAAPAVEKEEAVHPAPRVLLETLAGGAGSATGGLLGGIVGLVVSDCAIVAGDCSAAALFALSGIVLGSAASTYLAGRLMNGRGGFLGTLIGSAVGTGAGLLLLASNAGGDGTVGLSALLALPAVGAVGGYELSGLMDDPARFSMTVTHEAPTLVPVIGTTPRGGFMGGLSGRF